MKSFIYVKHNLPSGIKPRLFTFFLLSLGILFIIFSLVFTAIFAVVSLPVAAYALYRFNKSRNYLKVKTADSINVKEYKVIDEGK